MHSLLQSVIDIAARGEGKNRNIRVFVQRRFAFLTTRQWRSLRIGISLFYYSCSFIAARIPILEVMTERFCLYKEPSKRGPYVHLSLSLYEMQVTISTELSEIPSLYTNTRVHL